MKNDGNNTRIGWAAIRLILLCVFIALFVVATLVAVYLTQPATTTFSTREETKTRLMYKARYEGWDPYSSDMTLEEFYALMELFDEGKLPLNNKRVNAVAKTDGSNEYYIPREMFMVYGIPADIADDNPPLEYDNEHGHDDDDYPADLDTYEMGYMRPSFSWPGIEVGAGMEATIIMDKPNEDYWIGGSVDQSLFQKYADYYVKQVAIDGVSAAILGMVKMQGTDEDKYVYYYLSSNNQDTAVTTTTLQPGKKFVIQYVPYEHLITYKVEMADGGEAPEGITEESIFGKDHPLKTTDGSYAFTVIAPYEYEMAMILQYDMTVTDVDFNGTNYPSVTFTVEEEQTGTRKFGKTTAENIKNNLLDAYESFLSENGITGFDRGAISDDFVYNGSIDTASHQKVIDKIARRVAVFEENFVNNGYALGTEPIYDTLLGSKATPSSNAPSIQMMTATFSNSAVDENRTVIALLRKINKIPWFSVPVVWLGPDNTNGRGTTATNDKMNVQDRETNETVSVPYDYEDEFLSLTGKTYRKDGTQSKYIWPGTKEDNTGTNGNAIGNIRTADKWVWDGTGYGENNVSPNNSPMTLEADGTYSWQWTFQTNNTRGGYTLDAMEINGKSILIPYSPKYLAPDYNGDEVAGTASGTTTYVTETTLDNGAKIVLEYLAIFNNSTPQRVYRVTVTGAKSNVSVTALNLMMGTGHNEISVNNLVGVYLPQEGSTSQLDAAVEFYTTSNEWHRIPIAGIYVTETFDFKSGPSGMYGANVRFKAMDGYGSPYYAFESRLGGVIDGQTSVVEYNSDGTVKQQNDVINLSEFEGDTLEKGFIYYDDRAYIGEGDDRRANDNYGYYVFRLTGDGGYKIGLLTVIARPARYVLHYLPEEIYDEDTGEYRKPDKMPQFTHNELCHPSFNEEYDDNNGFYYDLFYYYTAKLPTDADGAIRPEDPTGKYIFKDWVVVDENGDPILIDGKEVHFYNNSFNLNDLYKYAVLNDELGGTEMDVYVIRFAPTWEVVQNPYYYNIVLSWINADGEINEFDFSENWREVLTEEPQGGKLYVYLNRTATPLLDWIAVHPTYTFWDDVNNAFDDEEGTAESKIDKALRGYVGNIDSFAAKYQSLMGELTNLDYNNNGINDFDRLGGSRFVVYEDHGIIRIWMYENKGGLVFHKDVLGGVYTADEEFYFTVSLVTVGENQDALLNGQYKAYPEVAYDDDGKQRPTKNSDAWLVTFTDGEITKIEKGGVNYGNYFTLKAGEGIQLYIPAGSYTIAETGSKSGGAYKVGVTYTDSDGNTQPREDWTIPQGDDLWLKGKSKAVVKPELFNETLSQVSATVNFTIGENHVVQTLTFTNMTMYLSVEKQFGHDGSLSATRVNEYMARAFSFTLKLTLPEGVEPLSKNGTHYYNAIFYRLTNGVLVAQSSELSFKSEGGNVWSASFTLRPTEKAVIVTQVVNGTILYEFREDNVPSGLTPNWTRSNGSLVAGQKIEASVLNYYGAITYGYLAITESGGDGSLDEYFLYRIVGASVDITVSVLGDGEKYVLLPTGNYTVEEISDWSWKYNKGKGTSSSDTTPKEIVSVTVSAANATKATAAHADFINTRNDMTWVGDEEGKRYP